MTNLDGILNEIASVALLPRNDGILEFIKVKSRIPSALKRILSNQACKKHKA